MFFSQEARTSVAIVVLRHSTGMCFYLAMSSQRNSTPWLRTIEHTADVGIAVRADSLRLLFERVATAMFALLAETDAARPEIEVRVRVQASDRQALFVQWLSELNFIHQTRHLLFARFSVRAITDRALAASAFGYAIRPHQPIRLEIKAVTFHRLRIRKRGRLWHARVIFDV